MLACILGVVAYRKWALGVLGVLFMGAVIVAAVLTRAGVGPADWTEFPDPVSTERYFGDPSSSPQARAYYTTTSNARLAGRLKGDLLLIYGGVDEVVPLKEAMKLSNAFIAADKPFNLTIVPDSGHTAGRETYGVRETMRFFMEKLGGPVAR